MTRTTPPRTRIDADTLADYARRHRAGRAMYAAHQKGAVAQKMLFVRWCRTYGQPEARRLLAAWRRNEL